MNILMVYVVAIFLEGIPAFCIGMAMGWKIGCREAEEDDYYHEYRHDQLSGVRFVRGTEAEAES